MKTSFQTVLPFTLLAAACSALTMGLALPTQAVAADTVIPAATKPGSVERGRYIVTTAGCHDCHTPWTMGPKGPEPDMSRALSGHPDSLVMPPAPTLPEGPWLVVSAATNTAYSGPWGVSFTANLTPDSKTGIGDWTQRNFVDAIRSGRHMGRGRPLLPPMPWPVYRNMTDSDLASIYAYLMTIQPISNQVPEPIAPAGASASVRK